VRRWVVALVLLVAPIVGTWAASDVETAASHAESSTPNAGPAQSSAVVQQPRSFGYVIGDIVTQRVLLEDRGRPIVPSALPPPGPAGVWLERRASRVETDERGKHWLAIDYQIMNSPQALVMVSLPAFKVPATGGQIELVVSAWPISVAALTPQRPFAQRGLGILRPDRNAPTIDTAPITRSLVFLVVALVALIAAWIGWWMWRNWRASAQLPFGVAVRELRDVDDSDPRAWKALHRAFDGTAGQVVRADALGVLFQRAPQFERLRAPIERFYAQSGARFFGAPAAPAPALAGGDALSLHDLCADLRKIEKSRET
jgi:mxaA protein